MGAVELDPRTLERAHAAHDVRGPHGPDTRLDAFVELRQATDLAGEGILTPCPSVFALSTLREVCLAARGQATVLWTPDPPQQPRGQPGTWCFPARPQCHLPPLEGGGFGDRGDRAMGRGQGGGPAGLCGHGQGGWRGGGQRGGWQWCSTSWAGLCSPLSSAGLPCFGGADLLRRV